MTLNIADAESSYTYGRIVWMEFIEEFERQWASPIGEMQAGLLLKGITEEERGMLDNPDNLAKLEETFARLTGQGR